MRLPRLKVPNDPSSSPAHSTSTAVYHCLSRVVDRRLILHDTEKDHFLALLRECEAFCRVRVLTFAILSNHFHILVEVPPRPAADALPGPDIILQDLRRLSGHQFPEAVAQRFDELRAAGDHAGLATYLASFHSRMWDLSAFMKLLKQRFSQWYNARNDRKGTLWEERFRSVLVEGVGQPLVTMAAYIDLNPVRAGLVDDPKDYRWSGYGEAMAGRKAARLGVQALVTALRRGQEETLTESMASYRQWLYLSGDERREEQLPEGGTARGALKAEAVAEVLRAKGRLPVGEYVRCRVRYFSDGVVFGGREWVEDLFRAHRKRFGAKRRTGARKLRGLEGMALYGFRDLRKAVFG
jgi:putative transposase